MSVSENEPIQIRIFQYPDDYAPVIGLWGQAGPGIHLGRSDEPEEIFKKLARDPDLFLLAEQNSRLVGAVLGGFDGRRGMMYHLAVEPACRGQGIGEALMEELERRLVNKGCIRYYLLVTKDNADAIRFYEARGWDQLELYVYGKDLT
jgi:ribosomal protein S18 acetylase RimI-like enzyme